MTEMTSRERVYRAANFKEPDRVPLNFGGSEGTGIVECAPDGCVCSQLYQYLHIPNPKPIHIGAWMNEVWNLDERVRARLRSDILPVFPKFPPPAAEADGSKTWHFFCGMRIKRVGLYDEVFDFPMARLTKPEEVDSYLDWPDTKTDIMSGVVAYTKKLHEDTDKFIVGIDFFDMFPFNGYAFLSGMTKWLTDIKLRPAFYHKLADKFLELTLEIDRQFFSGVGPYVDGAQIFDDLGTQMGPLMSHNDFTEFYKPYMAEIIRNIRRYIRPEAKIILHSCGSLYPFIPDLIDIGVNILHGVQPLARNMEPDRLKRDFGDKICFMGGLDIQKLLPLGTPEEVREGVHKLLSTYGPGGGYIFAPAHNIEPDSPAPNIVAAYDAAYEYGAYPLKPLTGESYIDFINKLSLKERRLG
jgi:uroporphyrinogen decarboxylase